MVRKWPAAAVVLLALSGCASGASETPSASSAAATPSATSESSAVASSSATVDSGEEFREGLNSAASSEGLPVTADDFERRDTYSALEQNWAAMPPEGQQRTCFEYQQDPEGFPEVVASQAPIPVKADHVSDWLATKC